MLKIIPNKIPIITITAISSMRVNPLVLFSELFICSEQDSFKEIPLSMISCTCENSFLKNFFYHFFYFLTPKKEKNNPKC